MKSILQEEKKCYRCGTTLGLHKHHVFEGTANRKKSEQYGLTIWLCGYHHNLSNDGIHFDKKFDLEVKQKAQKEFEKRYGHFEFMDVFHRNYL